MLHLNVLSFSRSSNHARHTDEPIADGGTGRSSKGVKKEGCNGASKGLGKNRGLGPLVQGRWEKYQVIVRSPGSAAKRKKLNLHLSSEFARR